MLRVLQLGVSTTGWPSLFQSETGVVSTMELKPSTHERQETTVDPDQVLTDLREAFKEWSEIPIGDRREPEITARIAERFGYLDDWLSRGGYLPVEWQRHQPSSEMMRGRPAGSTVQP